MDDTQRRRDDTTRRAYEHLTETLGIADVNELPEAVLRDSLKRLAGEDDHYLRQLLNTHKLAYQRYQPFAYSVSSAGLYGDLPVEPVRILHGGSLWTPGEVVNPGVLSAVAGSDDARSPSAWNMLPETPQGRRLALAHWIAAPYNPLTARVMVNRIWQYHFGTGIVATANNLGARGDRPSHPELLDWLAQYFIEHRWSIKTMHRLIMRSDAYRRAAAPPDPEAAALKDAGNRLLSWFPARRLAAEEIRDALLAVSGALNPTPGGPGGYPEINRELALQSRLLGTTLAPLYVPSAARAERHRRTIYTVQKRGLVNPMLEVFDGVSLAVSCERRETTTVTPQVYQLFNSRFARDMARVMAKRIAAARPDNPDAQIRQAYRDAFGRLPEPDELAYSRQHLQKMLRHHRENPPVISHTSNVIQREHIGEFTGQTITFQQKWLPDDYQLNLQPHEVTPETRALAELCLVLFNANEFIYVY